METKVTIYVSKTGEYVDVIAPDGINVLFHSDSFVEAIEFCDKNKLEFTVSDSHLRE